jgi:hypothetical protein
MRWACIGERRDAYRVLVKILEGKSHLEDIVIDGRAILSGYSRNRMVVLGGLSWIKIGTSGGLFWTFVFHKKIGNYNHTDRNEEELTC